MKNGERLANLALADGTRLRGVAGSRTGVPRERNKEERRRAMKGLITDAEKQGGQSIELYGGYGFSGLATAGMQAGNDGVDQSRKEMGGYNQQGGYWRQASRWRRMRIQGLTLAPLVVKVDPNLNVVLTACLTVYVGCYRSVKPTPPSETMSNEHAMRFPLVRSAMLLSLFLLFKFLPKDLVNAVLTCYFFVLGIIALLATLLPAMKLFLPAHWNDSPIVWRFPFFKSMEVEFTRSQIVAAIPGTFFCAWYASKKHWLANNILGLAVCIQRIEMRSLGSFKTGAILLGGLFIYDIFWVFFTPVMVSVGKSFNAPIKLLFPTADIKRPFSMLGLGDIIIPGIFVALALRFDVSRREGVQYFKSAFLGYIIGLILTIVVMKWFQAAQPALLYIVPAVIGFLALHVIWNHDVKPLLEFDESKTAEESSDVDSTTKTSKKEEQSDNTFRNEPTYVRKTSTRQGRWGYIKPKTQG